MSDAVFLLLVMGSGSGEPTAHFLLAPICFGMCAEAGLSGAGEVRCGPCGTAEEAAEKFELRSSGPKWAIDCEGLPASLKRCPDTNLSFSAAVGFSTSNLEKSEFAQTRVPAPHLTNATLNQSFPGIGQDGGRLLRPVVEQARERRNRRSGNTTAGENWQPERRRYWRCFQ